MSNLSQGTIMFLLLLLCMGNSALACSPDETSCPTYDVAFCCPDNATCCGLINGACCPEGTSCCQSVGGQFIGCCKHNQECDGSSCTSRDTEKAAYILVQVVGLIFLLVALAWCCTWCRRQVQRNREGIVIYPGLAPPPNYGAITPALPKGVPPQIISQITLLQYEDGIFEENTCTVCLAEYVEGENVRVLPCNHNFHSICIEKWLIEHQTCPLCVRAVVVWK